MQRVSSFRRCLPFRLPVELYHRPSDQMHWSSHALPRRAVGLLRNPVLANDVDGALTQILGVGVEIYRIAFSRSCRREDVVLRTDQVETADRIILVLRVQNCRAVVEIFSCIRAFLFLDSLSKSIILVLLGIINQSISSDFSAKSPPKVSSQQGIFGMQNDCCSLEK